MTDQSQPPTDITPAPVATGFRVATVTNGAGESMVLLQAQTPTGTSFYFLDAAMAVQVGNALRAEGKAGVRKEPALSLPPPGLLIVPGR